MRILFLTPWYPDEEQPNHGIFVRDQVRALATAGHEVRVVTAKVNYRRFGFLSRRVTTENDGSVRVHNIRAARSFPLFNQVNFFLICRKETLRIITDFRPDIIHGNIGYPGACWSWLVSNATGIPYVITEHTLLHNNFRSAVHRLLTIAFIRRAHRVITVSRHSADIILKLTGVQAVVIPNVVDFSLFRDIHPFPPAPPLRIGFLGSSFFRKKGLDTLLMAIRELPDIELHIGGHDGTDHQHFTSMAESLGLADRCIFHGPIVRSAVPAFMSRLHFFVSASVFESFGVTIAEAMACGLPVVCTESGGPSDFTDVTSGILVPVGDVEKLRSAIVSMCLHYREYDREKIRQQVVRRFNSEAIATEIVQVYRTAVLSS